MRRIQAPIIISELPMARNSNSVHVVATSNGTWIVRREGTERASKRFDTQSEAIEWARDRGKFQGSDVVIHKRDGTIREKNSYGRDPNPPRDKSLRPHRDRDARPPRDKRR